MLNIIRRPARRAPQLAAAALLACASLLSASFAHAQSVMEKLKAYQGDFSIGGQW